MPLSKAKQAEWMKEYRKRKQSVIPKTENVIPNVHLVAHMEDYPQGFNPNGSYCEDYNEKLDPFINPLLRPSEPLPNCPDGRYR